MLLANSLPDPNSYAAIGWIVVIIAALCFGFNQLLELVARARGKAPHPPNEQLEANLASVEERLSRLEVWKDQLNARLAKDKEDILSAGEARAEKIHAHVERDHLAVEAALRDMPAQIIGMLANVGTFKPNKPS